MRDGKQFGLDGVSAALGGLRKPAPTEAVAVLRARVAEFAYGTLTDDLCLLATPHQPIVAQSGGEGGRERRNGRTQDGVP